LNKERISRCREVLKKFLQSLNGSVLPEANLETKERLDLRPNVRVGYESTSVPETNTAQGSPKTLTREELMNALGGKRTMAADIEALRERREGAKLPNTSPLNT
jgi:hypothetical protein